MPQKIGERYEWYDCPGEAPPHLKDVARPILLRSKVVIWGCCFPPAEEWVVTALEKRPQQFRCHACQQPLGEPHLSWHARLRLMFTSQHDATPQEHWVPVDMLCPLLESGFPQDHRRLDLENLNASQPEQG